MSFDFKGTFNSSQFERFVAFARNQKADVVGRLVHLTAERLRLGSLSFAYNADGTPTTYVPDDNSYIAKLVAAYEVLGGDPFYDLNIRTRAQAVFLQGGDEVSMGQTMSNGEILGQPGLADGFSGELMDIARGWVSDALEYKRDYLERKIRRVVDYAEQLDDEVAYLTLALAAVEVEGAFESVYAAMQELINDPSYRAIYNDKGKDPMGKKTYAPFLPYEPGQGRSAIESAGRGNQGFYEAGEEVSDGGGEGTA